MQDNLIKEMIASYASLINARISQQSIATGQVVESNYSPDKDYLNYLELKQNYQNGFNYLSIETIETVALLTVFFSIESVLNNGQLTNEYTRALVNTLNTIQGQKLQVVKNLIEETP